MTNFDHTAARVAADKAENTIDRLMQRDLYGFPTQVTITSELAIYRAIDAGMIERGTRMEVVSYRYGTKSPSLIEKGEFYSWTSGSGGAATWVWIPDYSPMVREWNGTEVKQRVSRMMLNGRALRIEDAFSEERRAIELAAHALVHAAQLLHSSYGAKFEFGMTYIREAQWLLASVKCGSGTDLTSYMRRLTEEVNKAIGKNSLAV